MIPAQRFKIEPAGAVLGGELSYQLDPYSGVLTYSLVAKIRWFLFPIPITKSGSVKVDPEKLQSSSVKAGEKLNFGVFVLTVEAVTEALATCSFEVALEDAKEHGIAVLSLEEAYIRILSIKADGTIKGKQIPLTITEV